MREQTARALILGGCLASPFLLGAPQQSERASATWQRTFIVAPEELSTTGRGTYFILEPGYQLTLEGTAHGKRVRLVVSVLDETRRVGNFETRVVEERETQGGELAEVSRNYVAINPATGNVYYFGEDVDVYKNGKVTNHEGAWLHGRATAHFGLLMPGKPTVGQRYYQEMAPKTAMDRAEVVSVTTSLRTPAGSFERCLKTLETTPLEPGAREFKVYAPEVGLVQDGTLLLTASARKH